jgi:hypothetical protein
MSVPTIRLQSENLKYKARTDTTEYHTLLCCRIFHNLLVELPLPAEKGTEEKRRAQVPHLKFLFLEIKQSLPHFTKSLQAMATISRFQGPPKL